MRARTGAPALVLCGPQPLKGVDIGEARERDASFVERLIEFLHVVHHGLETDGEHSTQIERHRALVAQLRLVFAGVDPSRRDGARRALVMQWLEALGALLVAVPDDPRAAYTEWLSLLAWCGEGPWPDLDEAILDEARVELVIASARALHGRPTNAGRGRDGSHYAPVNELLAVLPDGKGGNLAAPNLAALREFIRKERATDEVARSSERSGAPR